MNKKTIKKIIAGSLAFVCAASVGIAAIATDGFRFGNDRAQVEQFDHNDQLSFGSFFGNGIMLTASADTATTSETGTPVFDSVVSDLGNISSYNAIGASNMPFAYQNLTLYENSTVTKIGVPVKTVSDYASACTFTVYVASYDDPLTAFTKVSEHKLTIPANTFTSNTVGEWHYFDTDIVVGDNQTLVFCNSADTVQSVSNQAGFSEYAIYKQAFSGVNTAQSNLYFDVYTSDSTTPSAPEDGAVRLTASFTPANATNQAIDWYVNWANVNTAWSSSKTVTDYVTITPTSDGALTADVECLQEFGDQVRITAMCRDNINLTATCTVDYAMRIKQVNFNFPNDTVTVTKAQSEIGTIGEETLTLKLNETFTMGADDVTITNSLCSVEDTYTVSAYIGVNTSVLNTISSAISYNLTAASSTQTLVGEDGVALKDLIYYYGSPLVEESGSYTQLVSWLAQNPDAVLFQVTLSVVGKYDTVGYTFGLRLNAENLKVEATSVSLDKVSILF